MNISFTTVVNTLLFSAVAIVLLCFLIDRIKVISGKYFCFLSCAVMMIVLRLLVPCEIVGVQNNIYLTRIYPKVYLFLTKPLAVFWGQEWSIVSVLAVVSLAGSIVCAGKIFLSYFAVSRSLKRYRMTGAGMMEEIVAAINREWEKNVSFRIVQSKEIPAPFIFGLRRPVIFLPEIDLSEEEWHYILSHEMAHYYHRDLWLRSACEILHIVYWWNPFVTLLGRRLVVFQERHIDSVITKELDERRMLDYLSCLVKVARTQSVLCSDHLAARFNSKSELQDRIKRLMNSRENKRPGKKERAASTLLAVLLVLFTVLLPTLVTLEPNGGIPDEILEDMFCLTPERDYLILDEEGKYEVYADGEYKFTSSQILEDTLHIYNREGERIK